jgi:hypothetical protein
MVVTREGHASHGQHGGGCPRRMAVTAAASFNGGEGVIKKNGICVLDRPICLCVHYELYYSMNVATVYVPMAIARRQQIDATVTRWYHCTTRCVRQAFLLGAGTFNRKEWIEDRLEELAQIFAVGVGGFSVMTNHLHVLLRLDPDVAQNWSDEEVTRRWGRLYPPRDKSRQPLPVTDAWVQDRLKDGPWVAKIRERLQSMSWFMKCLREPLARLANQEDKVRGAFFQSRFQCVAILDEESLLAMCTYVDLNPVAAGTAETPEASEYTSGAYRG